jgi:hypothetical protein
MVDRLTTMDASFLHLDAPDAPLHVGGVLVLEAPAGGVESLAVWSRPGCRWCRAIASA